MLKSSFAVLSARTLVSAAVAAALGGAVTAFAQGASAPEFTAEKCYGISKAGSNDCASTGNNSCSGTSRIDSDPNAWLFVPTGVCNKIVDGSLTAG